MLSRQSGLRAVLALAAALALVAGVLLFHGQPSSQEALLRAAPSELALPADPQQLGAWCAARKAQGTADLSSRARAWLNDCITLFGGPTPAPSATQSPSPSPSPTAQPSPSVSPTATTSPATTPPATTPPPSPSPTVGLRDCLHQLAACGFPNAANTGPSGTLTVVNGNVSLDNDGQVLRDTEVRGCVEVHGTGVLITNVRVVTANVLVEDTWVHDMEIDGGAHTDGMQINQGARNIVVRHSAFIVPTPGATSAIISWNEGSPQQQQVVIDGNLLSGGTFVLYCPREGMSDTRVVNNRFADPEFGYSDRCTGSHVSVWSGNVLDATGAALAAA